MSSNTAKGILVILCWAASIGAIGSHFTNQLFPWLPVFLGVGALLLLAVGPRLTLPKWVGLCITVGVFYRVYVFVWPASMIGLDPDKFAGTVVQLMRGGNLRSISNLDFYSSVPLSQIYGTMVGLVTGLPGQKAVIVFPIALGIALPIGVAVVARRLAPVDSGRVPAYAAGFAATVGTVATDTILFGYGPISETMAVILWIGFFVSLVYYFESKGVRRLLFVPFLVGVMFSHKLGLVVIAGSLATGLLILSINRVGVQGRGHGAQYQPYERGYRLFAIVGAFLVVQLAFLTNWIRAVALSTLLPLLSFSFSPGRTVTRIYPLAEAVPSTLAGRIALNVYWPILLAVGAVTALYLWYRNGSAFTALILGATATSAVFAVLGFVLSSESAPVERILFYAEPVVIIVIAVSLAMVYCSRSKNRTPQTIVAVVLVVLIATQVSAGDVVPDYPNTPRYYLNSQEVTAKEFAFATTPDSTKVYSDEYYARETVVFNRPDVPYWFGTMPNNTKFQGPGDALLKGDSALIDSINWTVFAYRRDVDVYRTTVGAYRLQWNPQSALDDRASSVYSNGGVTLYWR